MKMKFPNRLGKISFHPILCRLGLATVQGKQNWWGILFLIPSMIFLIIFKLYPMLWAAELSLYDYDLIHFNAFVGLGNYIDLLRNEDFLRSLFNSAYYVAGSVVPICILSLGLALILVRRIPGREVIRLGYFIPVIMASIVIAVVWKFLYHPYGLVNSLLSYLGFGQINWLTSSRTAMPALIFIGIWRGTPYFMIIFLGGLLAIPREYYDAARIDGASELGIFRYITLPLLRPTILLVIVMAVIIGIKVFINPLVITHGGPAGATRVLPLLIYQTAFEFFKMGKASAMSIILFAIVMIFTLIQIKLFTYEE
jgi:multiple sugar transport system permease protein